ncbi:MAG TPA: hypothetical protein VM912_06130, partial [Terriglobales bacterium]|nr:hypothetical protein [Terriglobales bacterium]
MNQKELRELIEFLKEQDIAEFELERGDVKVRIKRGTPIAMMPPALQPSPSVVAGTASTAGEALPNAPAAAKAQAPEEGLHQVKSPIVGTFYESPSPGSPPFVKAGDTVE